MWRSSAFVTLIRTSWFCSDLILMLVLYRNINVMYHQARQWSWWMIHGSDDNIDEELPWSIWQCQWQAWWWMEWWTRHCRALVSVCCPIRVQEGVNNEFAKRIYRGKTNWGIPPRYPQWLCSSWSVFEACNIFVLCWFLYEYCWIQIFLIRFSQNRYCWKCGGDKPHAAICAVQGWDEGDEGDQPAHCQQQHAG